MKNKTTSKAKPSSSEPVTPIRPPKKTELSLRVDYTEKELLEIGKKLAEANRELEHAEGEKKAITGTLKAKCDGIAARISQHSGELTNGYTFKNIPCEVRYDNPSKGMKTTVRLDNHASITTEAMTLGEMQAELSLAGVENPAPFNRIEIPERPKAARVSADGVVLTEEDGDSFTEEDDHKL